MQSRKLLAALVFCVVLGGALGQRREREQPPREDEPPRETSPRAENATAEERRAPEPREEQPRQAQQQEQGEYPSSAFNMHIVGAHWNPVDVKEQRIVHHYCNIVDPRTNLIQCALYDGNSTDARLIGIEYVVSRETAAQMPVEERKLWHSHAYEVRSGLLTVPELEGEEEMNFLSNFANSYGKIYHTWRHTDLPTGIASIDMSFTADGQINPELSEAADALAGTTARERAEEREDIEIKPLLPGVDYWQTGAAVQLGGLNVRVDPRINDTLPEYIEREEADPEDLQMLEPRSVVAFPPLTGKGTPAQPFAPGMERPTDRRRRGPAGEREAFRSPRTARGAYGGRRPQFPQAYYQPAPSYPVQYIPAAHYAGY